MLNMRKRIAAAHAHYAQKQEQSAQLRAAIATGGSYALWRAAIAEEDAAKQRLQRLYAEAGYADVVVD